MSEREYEALRSALASTRMEGFRVTEQTEKDCIRLMSGEVSVADLVKETVLTPSLPTVTPARRSSSINLISVTKKS